MRRGNSFQGCIDDVLQRFNVDDLLHYDKKVRGFLGVNFLVHQTQVSNIETILVHYVNYVFCVC